MLSPVTQTAEKDVNNASTNDIGDCVFNEIGKLRSKLPIKITNKKPRIIILAGFTFNQFNRSCSCDTRTSKKKMSISCETKKLIEIGSSLRKATLLCLNTNNIAGS